MRGRAITWVFCDPAEGSVSLWSPYRCRAIPGLIKHGFTSRFTPVQPSQQLPTMAHCHWDCGGVFFQSSLLSLFMHQNQTHIKVVELMKATLFNKSLPNSRGYQKEEFITQAYLYLLPEWSDQWLLDFVVSENNLSYIPLIARSPATFSFASYSTRDFPVQLSVCLVVSVKNTKKYQVSATALHHKSCSHKQHGMTEIFICYGNIALFMLTLPARAKGINTWDLDLCMDWQLFSWFLTV